jgi:death on curing protein
LPSGKRHYRLTLADALGAHDLALQYGGLPGILNLSLIESAIQRPYSGYHRSIHRKAAALVHSVARNHGFVDGNKRTCLLLLGLLLDRSGYRLVRDGSPETNEAVEEMIVSVAKGEMSFNNIDEWMRERIKKSK